jgi:serine/threonine-protein kinase
MTDPRWTTVDGLFEAALERAPHERAAFLDEACAGDQGLRREVESLLEHDRDADDFLAEPALELVGSAPRDRSWVGRQFGFYRVDGLLGSGGMGEVYRAHDTKLGRDVAIKTLPTVFSSDPDRRSRFVREARLLAALNHLHIGAIYGFDDIDGTPALILELVDGDTLAERIASGPIPIGEALTIARQITVALEAAHDHGIVHRDLKPTNIKITTAGVVKVLDFGLAKAHAEQEAGHDRREATAPTAVPGSTCAGVILGTAAYMSPEQARGQAVDKRTDIWAFGCVLFEMLTGRVAFAGNTISETTVAIQEREPAWSALDVPAGLRLLMHRCLQKDPHRRLHDIADARIDIDDLLSDPSRTSETPAGKHRRPAPFAWRIAAVALIVAVIAAGALTWGARTAPRHALRVSRTLLATPGVSSPSTTGGRSLAITPDGSHLVYLGNNATQLFVSSLDSLEPKPIVTGIRPLNWICISTDGQWIAFVEGFTLRKVALTGGPVTTIALVGGILGATWAPDGTMVLATSDPATGLLRISSSGGELTTLTRPAPERGEQDHVSPELLPRSRGVLYTITAPTGGADAAQVAVLDLATGRSKVLLHGASDARYVSSGHLVYAAGASLRVIPFDLERLQTRGAPVTAEPRLVTSPLGTSEFVVSLDGTLAYVDAPATATRADRTLVWVDRRGREEPLPLPPGTYLQPRVSRDGRRVAVVVGEPDHTILVLDLPRRNVGQLRVDRVTDFFPVWMPDGQHLVFASLNPNQPGMFRRRADGTGTTDVLGTGLGGMLPSDVTRDGRHVLFSYRAQDVKVLSLDGTRQIQALIETPSNERNGVVSPDGRWLAYESDSSGQFEIYVRPFPNVNDGEWKVSTSGGTRPLWAPNWQELFYVGPSGAVMAARVDARGSAWSAGAPQKTVVGPYLTLTSVSGRTYDVSPDGQRFLMVKQPATRAPAQIVIVQNWFEDLRRLVPASQ